LKMFELAAEKMPKETEFGTFNMSFVIGQLKGRGGDCASAVESFTKYLDAPGFHKDQALRARAECYVKLGKKEEAISDYRALLDAAKEALKSTEEFGWGEDSAVIYKEAIEELEQKISEIEKSGQ